MTVSEYPIAFAGAEDYTPEIIFPALTRAVEASGFTREMVAGRRVLLKPNLLMKRRPEEATTTHPLVVEAAARLLLDWGASEVTIADSPGGPYTRPLLHSIYETCGMTAAARQSGARLNEDTGFTTLRREENRLVREFSIINPVAEADLVVSVCKLKTHSMTTLSGGVKNLFGCIPGLLKPELHLRFPEKADFGEMLVDLALTVKPALTIVDAVVGMEGDGPSGGSPRKLGFLAACQNPFLLDLALCRIIGVTPESVPTIAVSQRRGLCPENADALSLAGEVQFARPVPGFVPPHAKSVDFLSHTPRLLRPAVSRLWNHLTPRPVIRRKDCVGCGRCAESCPAHTITIVSGKAQIRYDRCIHCYCCHEMCPVRAIDIRRTRFFDL